MPVEAPRRSAPMAGEPAPRSMRDDVLEGLRADPKHLSPKYFYDNTGARLFEQITTLDAYYPTRTELAILRGAAGEIADRAGPRVALIEYGSGAGTKVRLLLDALEEPVAYVPIDIAGEQLRRVALTLRDDYPKVDIHPVRADYTRALDLPKMKGESRHVAFFPGSTIGNFEPSTAASFLRGVRDTIGDDGAMILGVDRVKDVGTLEAAYNDPEGITARFNLNLLARLNRELDATFPLDQFRHRAWWNAAKSRMEMHLESLSTLKVEVAGETVHFDAGETIWTESSYKYERAMLDALVTDAGFRVACLWTDPLDRFWVAFLDAI